MRFFCIFFLLISSARCVTGQHKEYKSSWIAVAKSEEISCLDWPQRPKDLRVNRIEPMLAPSNSLQGFVVSGQRRDTARTHYFAPFEGDLSIDQDDYKSLELPRGGVMLGGTIIEGKKYAFTAINSNRGVGFELRSIPENIVQYQGELPASFLEEGQSIAGSGGIWVNYRDDRGTERLAYVRNRSSNKLEIRPIPINMASKPIVIPLAAGAFVVWKANESKKPFRFVWVPINAELGPELDIDFTAESLVESWTFALLKGRYYLAVIDGDTLIGQARIKVSEIALESNSSSIKWSGSTELKDTHATEPALSVTKNGVELLVLNWIDEESTIARYKVGPGSISRPTYAGVFPKATKIVGIYSDVSSNQTWLLNRYRQESNWVYSLCEL